MKPYIFEKRNLIHIIDIRETLKGLLRARKFLARLVANNDDVLFVGTKRQARESVKTHALRCNMHFVNERWLGGALTNFRTIRSRLQRLEELEALVGGTQWEQYSKKMQSTLQRELRKIRRNLDGIRRMNRLPGALVVIDVRKELNAVREAQQLNIPTICLIDTDSDPDFASIPIPGNDDAIRSIDLVLSQLADAIDEGIRGRAEPADEGDEGEGGGRRRRRGGRGGARGEDASGDGGPRSAGDDEKPVSPLVTADASSSGDSASS
jgi:small subunit ribosomal protein S2